MVRSQEGLCQRILALFLSSLEAEVFQGQGGASIYAAVVAHGVMEGEQFVEILSEGPASDRSAVAETLTEGRVAGADMDVSSRHCRKPWR